MDDEVHTVSIVMMTMSSLIQRSPTRHRSLHNTVGWWKSWICAVLVLGSLVSSVSGCADHQKIENARSRGAAAGNAEGRRAGDAAGFASAFKPSQEAAYSETLSEKYSSGQYREFPKINVAVFYCFIVVGFGLQWIAFYVFRRIGCLLDVDWIALPDEMTEVDLTDLSMPEFDTRRLSRSPRFTNLIVLFVMLHLFGCKSSEQTAWQEGYDANYKAAYQAGLQEGTERGQKEGRELGRSTAEKAADRGSAWQLYSEIAIWALAIGAVIGVTAQYIVLLQIRLTGRLGELWGVVFVPGIKRSVAYSIMARRRQLLIWWNEELAKVIAGQKLKTAQMKSLENVMLRKLKAISRLEDFSQARLVDLARMELSRIVASAEGKVAGTYLSEPSER